MARALTAPMIEKLRPDPAKRVEVSDGLLPALRVVVQPSGVKSYAIRFRQGGRTRKFTLGQTGALTLAEARDKARKALAAAAQGVDPLDEKRAARRTRTADENLIQSAIEEFVQRHTSKLKSGADVARMLRVELTPWRGRRIQEITKRDVIRLVDTVHDRGSPATARRLLSHLKSLFGWLVERDALSSSPCTDLSAPSEEVQRDRVLSDEELQLVLLAADRLGHPFGPMVRLLALTGARRDEIAGMRWAEVRLDGRDSIWSLPGARTKNGRPHDIPLAPATRKIIAAMPRVIGDDGKGVFVFTTTGNSSISGFSKARLALDKHIAEMVEEPMPAWRLHDLRRTFATGCARLGVALPVVEKCLNHVSGSFAGVVGIYQRHDFAAEKRAAFELWETHVTGLGGKE